MRDPRLATTLAGVAVPNPVGVAAGYDKRAEVPAALGRLGFGFVEVGTVTPRAQPGNPRPRLFRLPDDRALLNRLGFNNPGADAVAGRLAAAPPPVVLGINLGKGKDTPLERAAEDYAEGFAKLAEHAAYVTVNVSSPNTAGLRSLQEADALRAVLAGLDRRVPVLLKIAPDLTDAQVDAASDVAAELADGIVATNTTTGRAGLRTPGVDALGPGGVSGPPVRPRALEVVARIFRRHEGRLPIVGVGGIASSADAWAHLRAGATAVQLYTGLVYGGPGVARAINRGLLARLEAAGLTSITEVVGLGA